MRHKALSPRHQSGSSRHDASRYGKLATAQHAVSERLAMLIAREAQAGRLTSSKATQLIRQIEGQLSRFDDFMDKIVWEVTR